MTRSRPSPRKCVLMAVLAIAGAVFAGCGSDDEDGERSAARDGETVPLEEVLDHIRAQRARRQEADDEGRSAAGPPRPEIVQDPIPFPTTRKDEMAAYSQRHYGIDSYVLTNPKVIVEHVAVADSAASVKAIFTPDTPDPELNELPQVCSHFVIDTDGTIHQLVPLGIMCRHTVGLNYTAIGIEHAGFDDQDVLENPAVLRASLRLTAWLRCRYGIRIKDVIGHNESLSSPYHKENVAALRTQTHGDMQHASMVEYRRELATHSCRS